MPKRFYKHKLILDENMPARQLFPHLNELFDVKHIREDLNSGGISDEKVYQLAAKQKRLIITKNIKDFKSLAIQSQDTGVIGIPPNLSLAQIDRKLTALLMRSKEKALIGKYTSLADQEEIVEHKKTF